MIIVDRQFLSKPLTNKQNPAFADYRRHIRGFDVPSYLASFSVVDRQFAANFRKNYNKLEQACG